ncbi:hypothetical protein JCM10450v2_004384 [Rhodotorula kratochvilovae]
MGITWVDDADPAWSYTGFTSYQNQSAPTPGQPFLSNTYSGCDIANSSGASNCTARFSFYGSAIDIYSEYDPTQKSFYCLIDGAEPHYYNAAQAVGATAGAVNVSRCAVTGLELGNHVLTIGQTATEAGQNGVTVDFAVVDDATVSSETLSHRFVQSLEFRQQLEQRRFLFRLRRPVKWLGKQRSDDAPNAASLPYQRPVSTIGTYPEIQDETLKSLGGHSPGGHSYGLSSPSDVTTQPYAAYAMPTPLDDPHSFRPRA